MRSRGGGARRAAAALLAAAACSLAAAGDAGASWYPGRRRPQFPVDPGYAVLPSAYSLPGVGRGYGLLGAVTRDHTRSSYGAGLRVVTASGEVCRIDLAAGSEGVQPSIFFQYPWELL